MSQWGQLFGTQPPPRGTLADMANRYPSDMADQQNRDIALGAITPFSNAARWGAEQLSKLYDWLPDSATTQATKLRARMDREQGRTETNPYVYNALYPTPMPPTGPMPSQFPRTDQDFYRQLYAPRPTPPGPSSAANAGTSAGNPATPPSAPSAGLAAVAGKTARAAPMNSSAPPAPNPFAATPGVPSNLAALPFPNGSAMAYPPQQDANYFRQVPTLADVVGPPNPYGGISSGSYGSTGYAIPGVSAMGGQQPGLATFQGMPRGGTLGYAGAQETQGLSQEAATAANVAAYNRQIAALRDLREAQNPGITTGQAGRAFGNLVSFGTPGGYYGDEAMQAQQAQSYLNQAAQPGVYRGQRNALLQAGLALLNRQPPTATYLENAGPSSNSLTPFQAQQLLQDQQRQQFEQNRWAQQWPMDQQRGLAEIAKLRQEAAPKPPSESQQKAALIGQILEANQALPHAQTPEQQAKVTAYLNQLTGLYHQLFSKPDPLAALMAQQQPAQ